MMQFLVLSLYFLQVALSVIYPFFNTFFHRSMRL